MPSSRVSVGRHITIGTNCTLKSVCVAYTDGSISGWVWNGWLDFEKAPRIYKRNGPLSECAVVGFGTGVDAEITENMLRAEQGLWQRAVY